MYSFLLDKELSEENLLPCYFFHGDETFLAFQFAEELKETLISPDIQDFNLVRFDIEESSWAEIIDLARTIPFFLSPWRIILVEISKGRKESLSAVEKRLLEDYFSSPLSKTVIIIIFSGKIRKDSSLFKFFTTLPSSVVCTRELRSLKDRALHSWMDKRISFQGKMITPEAKRRLVELAGNDLRRINNEIDKLVTSVDQKKVIELDDVNQIAGWVKTFFEWEISDSLEKADFEQSLQVLNNLFKEGIKPEYILGSMVKFFRDIFLAKLLMKEKKMDRKAIFKELRPHIREKFKQLYATKFKEFFSLVDKFSLKDLNHILAELERIDMKVKTSSLSSQILMEAFLFDYCRLRRKGKLTWKEGR